MSLNTSQVLMTPHLYQPPTFSRLTHPAAWSTFQFDVKWRLQPNVDHNELFTFFTSNWLIPKSFTPQAPNSVAILDFSHYLHPPPIHEHFWSALCLEYLPYLMRLYFDHFLCILFPHFSSSHWNCALLACRLLFFPLWHWFPMQWPEWYFNNLSQMNACQCKTLQWLLLTGSGNLLYLPWLERVYTAWSFASGQTSFLPFSPTFNIHN